MRVFLLCADPGVPPDGTKGASVHLRAVAGGLAERGHEVTAFLRRPPGGGTDAFPVPVRPYRDAGDLVRSAEEEGVPDAVYERCSLGHLGGLSAARDLGRPLLLELNAPMHLEALRHRPASLRPGDAVREARLLREADAVLAVSEPLRAWAEGVRGRRGGMFVVRNGVDPSRFPEPGRRRPLTVAFLGNPKPWHGAGTLPALLRDLRGRGIPARLEVIGGGALAQEVAAGAAGLGLADAVEVTGELSHRDAVARLSRASVAVAPYPPHPFFYFCPLKVVEAMAAGVPVVTTEQGDLQGIVGDGGIMVPPGDPGAVCDAVAAVLTDPELAGRLGGAARARALGRFTWDHAARAIERVAAGLAVAA